MRNMHHKQKAKDAARIQWRHDIEIVNEMWFEDKKYSLLKSYKRMSLPAN